MATVTARRIRLIDRASRLKDTEPVRLYAYGWSLLLMVALLVAGAVTRQWPAVILALSTLLLTAPGIEAARISAYSFRGMLGEVTRSRGSWVVPEQQRTSA